MLVTRRAKRLFLVTQPDHAALAGQMGARWGNQRFELPGARDALLCAATHHDDGWLEIDEGPAYNALERRPAHFIELPLSETVGPYGRGVESVYARDPLAGALVGMHFSGFYTGRWGLGAGGPPGDPRAAEVVATQEARWMPALRQAWGYSGPRSSFDADVWHAYEVLQALDLLSLAVALLDLERPAEPGPALDLTSTLRALDQTAAPRTIPRVPVSAGGGRVDLLMRVSAPMRVKLAPYPFAEPEVEFELRARELEDRPYRSAAEAAAAFHTAAVRRLRITVAP